jgi:hypothetical protein
MSFYGGVNGRPATLPREWVPTELGRVILLLVNSAVTGQNRIRD